MPIRRSSPPRIKPQPSLGRAHRLGPRAGQELAADGLRLPGARAADGRRPVWRSAQSIVTPYVIEVDQSRAHRGRSGHAVPGPPMHRRRTTSRAQTLVRSLSIDPIVVRQNWLDAYDYTTDRGAAVLNDYARTNDPFARIGKESVTVQITSVVSRQ